MPAWVAGLLQGLLAWLFSGTVKQETPLHTPAVLAELGLDKKSLTGVDDAKHFPTL